MGIAAHNRGSKSIREGISQELKGRLINPDAAKVFIQEQIINEKNTEIESLKLQLAQAQAAIEAQKVEIESLEKKRQFIKRLYANLNIAYKKLQKKHTFLTRIISLGISPERFIQLEDIIKND